MKWVKAPSSGTNVGKKFGSVPGIQALDILGPFRGVQMARLDKPTLIV